MTLIYRKTKQKDALEQTKKENNFNFGRVFFLFFYFIRVARDVFCLTSPRWWMDAHFGILLPVF